MPVVISILGLLRLGCGWSQIYFRKYSFNYNRCISWIIRAILSYIMCKGMNRSFFNVILGGFGATDQTAEVKVKNKDQ